MSFPVAYVEWVDAGIVATRWDDREHVVSETVDMAAGPIQSAGFVITNDDKGVTLALSHNARNDDVHLALFIPRPNIRVYAVLR